MSRASADWVGGVPLLAASTVSKELNVSQLLVSFVLVAVCLFLFGRSKKKKTQAGCIKNIARKNQMLSANNRNFDSYSYAQSRLCLNYQINNMFSRSITSIYLHDSGCCIIEYDRFSLGNLLSKMHFFRDFQAHLVVYNTIHSLPVFSKYYLLYQGWKAVALPFNASCLSIEHPRVFCVCVYPCICT